MKYTFKVSLQGYQFLKADSENKIRTLFSLSFNCDTSFMTYVGMTVIFKQDENVEIEEELLEYEYHTGVFEVKSFYYVIPDNEVFVNLSNPDVEEEYAFEDALKICRLYKILYGFDFHY